MKKLPVIKIMIGALYLPWVLRKPLFKALVILIVAGILFSAMWEHTKGSLPECFGWLVMIPFWALYTLFAVICHRIVLLGGSSVPEYGVGKVSERDFRFGLALAKIAIIMVLAVMIGGLVSQTLLPILDEFLGITLKAEIHLGLMFWSMYVIQLFVLARLGFILPATAVDERPSLRWAWQVTRGNSFRLMFVLTFLPWLIYLPAEFLPEDIGLMGYGLHALVWWLFLPIEITVLSLCYKELTQEQLMT